MARAHVTEELPASADAAWACLADFGDMSAWAPDVKVVESHGKGLGAERLCDTQFGLVRERCEAYDAEARSFQYSLIESPFGYDRYLASVTLTPIDADRCRIDWEGEFEIASAPDHLVAKEVEKTYREGFIAELRKTLERQTKA